MDNKNFTITKIINRKPASIRNIKSEMKDECLVMNYTQNIISQIVKTREQKEFEFVCSQIQQFIEKENIDACFVMNKDELIDCLKGHKILHKALELACLSLRSKCDYCKYKNEHCPPKHNCSNLVMEYFIEQAKEILKSE